MADGKLLFETGIDNSGFSSGVSNLQATANIAMGNIAANMISQMSSAAAQIPQQMITVGSGYEASMSQVAATMGITSAAAEFKTLSDAAKEMGETTKFSASQAGEALNYLALAGYDANKAVAALPTVLNVAAAGGMELASASDMITDAMSALGLETSQMNTFADQLAVTSQKSNTSVSQLGEAILTVGGTAKSLSGGVTEMNTALGILADNGIKGSEGGTALRNVIYRPSNINADVHYVDEEHSLGFASGMGVYIGDKSMFFRNDGNAYGKYYVIGKDRNSLYFEWYSGASLYLTVIAAKASSGKWSVFFLENTAEKPKLYYNTPNTDFVICDPALKISEANTPYIISPYPDLSGGVMSELFRVDYLSAFDKNNPPVLAVGDGLYAVPPYPLHTSDTAAFAIKIDPMDYEQEV